jgi:hypothetical protein
MWRAFRLRANAKKVGASQNEILESALGQLWATLFSIEKNSNSIYLYSTTPFGPVAAFFLSNIQKA